MATQTVEFSAAHGQTVTAKLFPRGSDTQAASVTATAATNRTGVYYAAYTDVAAGVYQLIAVNGSGTKLAEWWVTLTLTTATFQAYEVPEVSASSGTGTGARTVTVTVNDGATALQNAAVRLTEGANSFKSLTNVSGVVTFNVDDATYTVGITKSGYTYAGTTLVVDGTEAVTYSMTAVSSTPPDDPALCAVTIHLRDQYGNDLAGEPVEITFVQFTADAAETPPVLSIPPVQTTSAGGLVEVELYRDAVYKVIYGSASYARRIDITVPDAATYEVEQ